MPAAGRRTEETQATMRTRTVGALSAMLLLLAGCGGAGEDYENAERQPAPVNVSVALTAERINVSPGRVGAGPIVLIVANESRRSREVTLQGPDGASASCVDGEVRTGPINPQGTGTLKLSIVEGPCLIGVADGTLPPARLTVGPPRASAQQELLQP